MLSVLTQVPAQALIGEAGLSRRWGWGQPHLSHVDCELRGGEPGQLSREKGNCRGPPLASPRVEGTDRSLSPEPGAVTLVGARWRQISAQEEKVLFSIWGLRGLEPAVSQGMSTLSLGWCG